MFEVEVFVSSLRHVFAVLCGSALSIPAASAFAHVSVQGPAFAGTTQVVTFSVGHGCAGADTVGIRVHLPEAVTSMRTLLSTFGGEAVVETSSAGIPLSATWRKADARAADDQYYQMQARIRIPDAPFTKLYFKVTQTCRDSMGVESVVEWEALPGEEGEEAASLWILPARKPGWNKFSVPVAVDDLTAFDDASIIWAGEKAYSGNPSTKELIAAEPGVEELSTLAAGTEIWVKY